MNWQKKGRGAEGIAIFKFSAILFSRSNNITENNDLSPKAVESNIKWDPNAGGKQTS